MLQKASLQNLSARELKTELLSRCRIGLTPYQWSTSEDIINAVLSGRSFEFILYWARQSGKTETLTISNLTLGLYFIRYLRKNFEIGIFSPAHSQAIFTSKERLHARYKQIRPWLSSELGIESNLGADARTTSHFYLSCPDTGCECKIHALSAEKHAEIKGPTLNILQLEQSENMDPDKMASDIFPMAAAVAGIRIHAVTSVTDFKNSYILERLTQDPRGSIKLPSYDVNDLEVRKYPECIPGYADYVDSMIEDLGEESDAFRTQFRLDIILPRNKLILRDQLLPMQEHYRLNPGNPKFGGVDVAKEDDSTVATAAERDGFHHHILGWLEREGVEYEEQADDIAEFYTQLTPVPQVVYVDSQGVGDPVEDMLRNRLHRHGIRVVGWPPTNKNNDISGRALIKELFAKPKSRISFPDEETLFKRERRRFIEQMTDVEKVWTGEKLKLTHPPGRTKHDDYVKSLEYCLMASLKSSRHSYIPISKSVR